MTLYLHVVDVAVEPPVERAELRAHQDEGLGDGSGLQESVQIINHPAARRRTTKTRSHN